MQACYTVRVNDMNKWGFEAAEKNVTEIHLPDFSQEQKPNLSLQTYVICDPKHKKAYAFRFELKTNTSSATATFAVPLM